MEDGHGEQPDPHSAHLVAPEHRRPALGHRQSLCVIKQDTPDILLVGNGSEVSTLVAANEIIKGKGVKAQIVSVPSIGLFLNQPADYRNEVIPAGAPTFGLTSGLPSTLRRIVPTGTIFGLDPFGASAPYKVLDEQFGFTPQQVADRILHCLK